MRIIAEKLRKDFGENNIFRDLSFEVLSGGSLAVTGPNGSGKTTLVRIICGLISPNGGRIRYERDDAEISSEHIYRHIGLVGPYLELYEELTAWENLIFFARMRRLPQAEERIMHLLRQVRLAGREHDAVKTYSSGMRQRLKYAFALLHRPEVLVLDEPTSNLDSEGTATVYEIMAGQKQDKILILATNDPEDLEFGDHTIEITV